MLVATDLLLYSLLLCSAVFRGDISIQNKKDMCVTVSVTFCDGYASLFVDTGHFNFTQWLL